MKICFFNDYRLGVVKGDSVVDVTDAAKDIPHTNPGNLINGLIERWSDYKKKIEDAANSGKGVPASSVKFR
ncbi:MAG TPA: fumarylacetoacetate hydrolase, partial [Stellaceae bacterium]|nr:fumarylacetoacetate hydrolase [Stellaceae bacterium]